MTTPSMGLLFDMVQCWGCRSCVAACLEIHDFEGDPEQVTELSATAFTSMTETDGFPVRDLCRHCVHPSCVSVCPVAALRKTDLGPVVYDAGRCMGCRYCMVACPFNVPRYQWDEPVPEVRKCDMCIDRLQRGEPPGCVEACPADATVSGTRDELLAEARRRIADSPREYADHVYGEFEVGGTNVLFLAPPDVAVPGYKAGLGAAPLPDLTMRVLEKIPAVAAGGCVALAGFAWIVRRRNLMAARRAAEASVAAGAPSDGTG